jgi:hypothetical protein
MERANKSEEKEQKDFWSMLAGLAMLGALQQGGQMSVYQEVSISPSSAGGEMVAASASVGASLNVQA